MSTTNDKDRLPKPARVFFGIAGLADAGLRTYALLDLMKRDAADINGSKELWVIGLSIVNSMGILPLVYLKWGRKG